MKDGYTLNFLSPEMVIRSKENYEGEKPKLNGEKSDVYSLGVTLLLDHLSLAGVGF